MQSVWTSIQESQFITAARVETLETRPVLCCYKTFFSKGTLQRHRCHQHAETCPFVCDACDKGFALQTDMRRHKASEAGKLKSACDICGFKVESKGALKDHLNMHIDDEESKRHQCSLYLKRFRIQSNLSRHSKTHSNDLYKCTNCDKIYKSEETLRVHHVKVHAKTPKSN